MIEPDYSAASTQSSFFGPTVSGLVDAAARRGVFERQCPRNTVKEFKKGQSDILDSNLDGPWWSVRLWPRISQYHKTVEVLSRREKACSCRINQMDGVLVCCVFGRDSED